MARPTIDAAQSAAAMIANIDRVIRETEQQERARTRSAPAPADGAAPPAPAAPPAQAPGGYGAPAPAAPPPQAGAAATGALGGYAPPPPPPPAPAAAAAPTPGAPPAPRPKPLEDLDVFLSRLRQFKDWLQQDPRLLAVVDDYIGQRVQQMEARQSRQNVRLAIITTVAGAILGWVTSLAGTPTVLLRLFGH